MPAGSFAAQRLAAEAGPVAVVVLSGLAGAGKTQVLRDLASAGAATLDLERLAGHSGSAFGGLGRAPQPTQRQFDEAVARSAPWLAGPHPGGEPAPDPLCVEAPDPLFIEDEGAFIGSLTVPPSVRAAIETAPVIELATSREERIARLVSEYQDIEPALLIRATQRIRRRIGGPVADRAISHFAAGRHAAAIDALLTHFDAAYRHRWAGLDRRVLARIEDPAGSPRSAPAKPLCGTEATR